MKALKSTMLILGIIILASCSEETPLTRKDMLTGKTWSFDNANGGSDQSTQDAVNLVNNLYDGSTFSFKANGTYVITYSDASTSSGNWVFENHDSNLIFDKSTVNEWDWFIMDLTSAKLQVNTYLGSSNAFEINFN